MRALDLVAHRLADVVEQRGALGRLHPGSELGGHEPAEVHDLERVLQDVLAVARPVPEPAEDLDELLVQLAAVRLEDRLLAGLPDVLVELRLRLVVHLLDPGRVDTAVLDELVEREARDLAPERVERRQHDRVRRVVDDEVDARQVLERPDVAALAPDDPPLQVVGRELDDGHGRLRGVARCDPLQRVRDERARATPGVRTRLLLHVPDVSSELVADEVLRALEELLLRLVRGQPGEPLEDSPASRPSPRGAPPGAP